MLDKVFGNAVKNSFLMYDKLINSPYEKDWLILIENIEVFDLSQKDLKYIREKYNNLYVDVCNDKDLNEKEKELEHLQKIICRLNRLLSKE